MEFNKLVASVLVAGLVFMGINVGVDEALHKNPLEKTVYPVPEAAAAVTEEPMAEDAGPSLMAMIGEADMEKGKKLMKRCAACHGIAEGGPNKVGPNLWGVVGADIASHEGFSYSKALTAVEGEPEGEEGQRDGQ